MEQNDDDQNHCGSTGNQDMPEAMNRVLLIPPTHPVTSCDNYRQYKYIGNAKHDRHERLAIFRPAIIAKDEKPQQPGKGPQKHRGNNKSNDDAWNTEQD